MKTLFPGRRRAALIGLAALALATIIQSRRADAADRNDQLNVGGQVRTFGIHIPDASPPPGGFPVILTFHGGGGQGAAMRRLTGFDAFADSRGFIAVYPDGIGRHWNDGRKTIHDSQDDVGFVVALLDWLQVNARVDRSRIFAAGLSNGALFAERLGCDLSGHIAAIAAVAGTLPVDTARACNPTRSVAVLQIAGVSDPIMPYGGGKVADFGGRGEGGTVLSVARTAELWRQRNGCGSPGTEELLRPTAPLDPTQIAEMVASGCPPAGPVRVISVIGAGHTWPGGPQYAPVALVGRTSRQFSASRVIVDFFLALPP
ncbi:MAG: PHB depolymerase family esterase [Tardiphaga sp.]